MGCCLVSRTNYTRLQTGGADFNDADVSSIVKRFEPITEAERDEIPNPVNGMLIYNSDTNLIDGYIDGSWPAPSGESIVIAHEDAWVQTRTQNTYVVNDAVGDEHIIEMDIVITPSKAGNVVVLDFDVFGESNGPQVLGFVLYRNGVILPDSSNVANDRWAINGCPFFETNATSTPQQSHIRLYDNSSLAIASTYALYARATFTGSLTWKLNRSFNSAGSDSKESGVSLSKAVEYVT